LVLAGEKVRNYRPTLKLQCRGQSNLFNPLQYNNAPPKYGKEREEERKKKKGGR